MRLSLIVKDGDDPDQHYQRHSGYCCAWDLPANSSRGKLSSFGSLEVAAGESRTIGPLSLAPGGMQDFADPAGWKSNQGWFVHRGGGFVLYNSSPTAGTFDI